METRRGTQGNFQLAGFPKEFERNLWEELDKRYVLILLIIWVVSFTFTYFMSSRDWRLSEAEMEKIKREALAKVYGKIVVETEPTTTTKAPEAVTVEEGGGAEQTGGITIAAADLGVSGRASGAASRDPESLIRVVNKNKSGVEYCIQRALKINPSLKGRIDVEIEINPSGRVIAARIIKSTLKDKSLERCILRKLKRWRGFGKIDPSYGNLKLRLPFIV